MTMASLRLECLNSMKAVSRKVPGLRAGFSTSRSLRANGPPTTPSYYDDVENLISPESPGARSSSIPARPVHESSILPRRSDVPLGAKKPQPGNEISTGRVSRLLKKSIKAKQDYAHQDSIVLQPRESSSGGQTASLTAAEELKWHTLKSNLSKQISRRFKEGDLYSPRDLSPVEMDKWRKRGRPAQDVFDALDLNPLDHYRNFAMISEYMTPMGRIKHSKETGLRPVNQRRIARTIRRAIGMGLTPSVHRHPEILQRFAKKSGSMR